MAPNLHTVPESCQSGDDYQNWFCCSDLDLVICCHDCIIGSVFSEKVLIVDYLSTVDTDMEVVDTELQQHMNTNTME